MLQTSLTGQMIPPGIQGTALGIWHRSASESFVPCLVSGHQPAFATTTSEREIKRDGIYPTVCSSVLFAWVSLSPLYQLSRLVVILAKHKGDWSRTLSNTCRDEYLKARKFELSWKQPHLDKWFHHQESKGLPWVFESFRLRSLLCLALPLATSLLLLGAHPEEN